MCSQTDNLGIQLGGGRGGGGQRPQFRGQDVQEVVGEVLRQHERDLAVQQEGDLARV